ncbi:MAG TPA: hypothetical protein VF188_09875 [Longimicrobiales bacterium]
MHWVRITKPRYDQSRRHAGRVGEVVGHWGPENSADGRNGYLVEFPGGEIVGVTHEEVEVVEAPDRPEPIGDSEDERGAGLSPDAAP